MNQGGKAGTGVPKQRVAPKSGQESVWDYPRPPRVEPSKRLVTVQFADVQIARTARALRVLETAGPPVYYLPPEDVDQDLLVRGQGHSFCEWKGDADYFDLVVGERRSERAVWIYPNPSPAYAQIEGFFAFYAGRVDACYLDDELVTPQPGPYYGGWITDDIVGPFKGEPGTENW